MTGVKCDYKNLNLWGQDERYCSFRGLHGYCTRNTITIKGETMVNEDVYPTCQDEDIDEVS